MRRVFFVIGLWFVSSAKSLAWESKSVSVMSYAFAPNVDGQYAPAVKFRTEDYEWSVFQNQYLLAGGSPLIGATVERYLSLCGSYCFLQHYLSFGAGITSAGPLMSLTWSFEVFWLARIDFSNHFFITEKRLVTWGYPLWIGVTVPLDF